MKSHPISHFLKRFIAEVDDDPRIQLRIIYSIYANWTSDYTGMSSS